MSKYTIKVTFVQTLEVEAPSADVALLKARELANNSVAEVKGYEVEEDIF